MRLVPTLTSGLSAAAALVLLTACGGSDSGEAASSASSSAAPSSSASSAPSAEDAPADPEAEAFCTEAQEVFTDLESAGTTGDPAALPALLAEASERISAIEAPAEISGSWDELTQAFAGIVADTQDLDLSTPEGQAAFTTALGSLQGDAAAAQSEVQTYVQANCDLPSAPTS
ncbi:MAG: hypothetical protein JWQ53_1729 [Klenkia sp.]|nr:hypothetical protein [Klenkia sp.]